MSIKNNRYSHLYINDKNVFQCSTETVYITRLSS